MEPELTKQQVETLARGLVQKADVIIAFYQDPEHERAFQAWHLEKYGYPAPDLAPTF